MITTVGVWTGTSSLRAPQRDVAAAVSMGVTDVHIMCNDHSGWRRERNRCSFTTYDKAKIIRLAAIARDHGLAVHLTSWLMPHQRYIVAAAEELLELVDRCEAMSLLWDAEEPWRHAVRPMPYAEAAALVHAIIGVPLRAYGREMALSDIVYTAVPKVQPLAAVCDYLVPQAYVTARQAKRYHVTPTGLPRVAHARWGTQVAIGYDLEGRDDCYDKVVMGLAGYRQDGIPGYATGAQAMQDAVDSTVALGVESVIFWSLAHLRRDRALAAVVHNILNRKAA